MGGGNGGGNPETGDDSYIYNGEGIGQQPTEGYDGKTSCRINVQSLIRIGTCLWLFEIGALLPVSRRLLKEFSTNFLF